MVEKFLFFIFPVIQVLKERISWLEATNEDLCRELHVYRSRCGVTQQDETDGQVC